MIILIDEGKTFNKIQYPVMIKLVIETQPHKRHLTRTHS